MRGSARFLLFVLAASLAVGAAACRSASRVLDVDSVAPPRTDRPLRLRIYVSGTYASRGIGTHAHIRAIVRDADAVFAARVGAHLVIEDIVDGWKVDVGHARDALRDLIDQDPEPDVDVVVGMLGPSLQREDGCYGMADPNRAHMVVRSEDTGGEAERAQAVVGFLHELAHVLGAPHDNRPGSIMAEFDVGASPSFTDASVQIVRSGLARRGIIARTDYGPDSMAVAGGHPPEALTTSDLATFDQALGWERRGAATDAWQTAAALFARYPSLVVVQDLRCRLARARDLPWPEVRAECATLMQLMTSAKSTSE